VSTFDADALLVRSVPYGESDLVATFVTAEEGKVAAIVRGGRKSTKRFGGALEPLHTVRVRIDDKRGRGGDLGVLREAQLVKIRGRVATDLDALDCAGTALRWARSLIPARTAEELAWATLTGFLDALDEGIVPAQSSASRSVATRPRMLLAVTAIRLLGDVGYGLELERCVGCQKPCPEGRAAYLDVRRGGLVCTACGGARRRIDTEVRKAALLAQRASSMPEAFHELVIRERTAKVLLELVHETLAAHVDLEP
jgi:DNA repair protein RecO (recombination protein O)